MKCVRRLLVVLVFFTLAGNVTAAVLKGVVRNLRGEVLPFATIFVKGTTNGTAANAKGEYMLSITPGNHIITCQFLGYHQSEFPLLITNTEALVHNFDLEDEGLQMLEIIVKANDEDPAYRIIRKAIAKRAFHLKQVRSFQTGIYLKGVFRTTETPDKFLGQKINKAELGVDTSGKGVLYLCEEEADYYAQEPNKERTIIHSVRESGNSNGLGFAQVPSVITFYNNSVEFFDRIAPRGFVSPIADNAIGFYTYKLEGEMTENGKTIYKIKVTPRRKFEPVFTGYIYIVEGDWAIHSLDLATTDKNGIEYLESLRIGQFFLPIREDTWVIKSQVFQPQLKLFGFNIAGNFVTLYDNQKVNEPVADSIFSKKIISTYDKTANKKDTSYWRAFRPIPLEADEVKDYQFKDSLAANPKDELVEDSLRRRKNRIKLLDLLLNGKTIYGKKQKQNFSFNALVFATNYNTVEGLNISPDLRYLRKIDSNQSLGIRLQSRYGFENRHFNVMGGIVYTLHDKGWKGRGLVLGADGGKYVFQYNSNNPVIPILNTFSTLLYNQNYLKLYERWDAAIYSGANLGNGLRFKIKLNYQDRIPLDNEATYSWASDSRSTLSPNLPAGLASFPWYRHKALLADLSIAYRPGNSYIQYPDFKAAVNNSSWPLFYLNYTKGIPGILNSKVDYDKWRLGADGEVRMKLFGVVNYNVFAGGFLNRKFVSLPDLMHLDGNEYFLANAYRKGFQLAPYYKFSNTEKLYGEAHIEYSLHGFLSNKIPLFRQLKWYFIMGANSYYAGNENYYTEAFFGLDNIGFKLYRFLRVDIVHSWESNGPSHLGVRFGIRGASFFSGPVKKNGEWNER